MSGVDKLGCWIVYMYCVVFGCWIFCMCCVAEFGCWRMWMLIVLLSWVLDTVFALHC